MSADCARVVSVHLGGPLGDALDANHAGRLTHFITDEHSAAIALFDPAHRDINVEGDWYGEHAGKWLYAAAKAVGRTRDDALTSSVRRVADHLLSVQEADGYLGTYAPSHRFMQPQPPRTITWDGAPRMRTWDIWTHAYLMLGLIEAARQLDAPRYLDAARRIGDLCWRTFVEQGRDITGLGNHFGMSATVLMDPACELFFATGEPRYLELAECVLGQADANPSLALLTRALQGVDASEIGTGKAYQLAWNLVGLAKLHRATGKADYRTAVDHVWRTIREHHLTLGGGPWGGVAHRSREVFNPPNVFSPQGYVETCSTLAWIQLNRELLTITGDVRHAEEIERSAYNDLIGAQAPDGEDWCYYQFPNGPRVHTTYWRCCKSSGAMALEELPGLAYAMAEDGAIVVNLHGPGAAVFELPVAGRVVIEQVTRYPFDGNVRLRVEPEHPAAFAIRVRVPAWSEGATLQVVGEPLIQPIDAGTYVDVERHWRFGDVIEAHFPMHARVHYASNRNVQESRAPDGAVIRQQVLGDRWLAVTRGPLVYATGLIDGYRTSETVRDGEAGGIRLREVAADGERPWVSVVMEIEGRDEIAFEPWYSLGGRSDGAWRITWLSIAPTVADVRQPATALETG